MNILLIIFIIITIQLHLYAMEFAWSRGKIHYKDKLLNIYDIIHANSKDYSKYNYTKNWFLLVFIIQLIFNLSKFTTDFVNEYLLGFFMIIFIRSLMIMCTILPKQNNCGVDKLTYFNKTIGGTCYDKMFSGHFAFGLFTTLLLFKHDLISNSCFNKILFIILNITHFIIIAITRSHYTIDIVVAFFVTILVYLLIKERYIYLIDI